MATTEYLNNKTFEILIVKYQETKKIKNEYEASLTKMVEESELFKGKKEEYAIISQELININNELAKAFYILSANIVRYAKFNLIDNDDAIQEGVMICFEKINRFDPQKGKAFNYCTTCILNHYRQLYRTARNYNELKRKYIDFLSLQHEIQMPTLKTKSIYKKHNIVTD